MEFRGKGTNWLLTVSSEFLFNKLILKFCRLVNGIYIEGELVNCHALFQRLFFEFFKTDYYLSVMS